MQVYAMWNTEKKETSTTIYDISPQLSTSIPETLCVVLTLDSCDIRNSIRE